MGRAPTGKAGLVTDVLLFGTGRRFFQLGGMWYVRPELLYRNLLSVPRAEMDKSEYLKTSAKAFVSQVHMGERVARRQGDCHWTAGSHL